MCFPRSQAENRTKFQGMLSEKEAELMWRFGGGRFLEEALMPWVGRGPRDRDGSEEEIMAPRFSGTCI